MTWLKGLFEEDNGRPSYMRAMCAVFAVTAVALAFAHPDKIELVTTFLVGSTGGKIWQKYKEGKASPCEPEKQQ